MNVRALPIVVLALATPVAASANSATSQTIVSMSISGSSCSVTSSSNANFGTLANPITATQQTNATLSINCGASSPAVKIAFNDAKNTGDTNFTMTNSTTTTATQTYQICDYSNFSAPTCPNGFQYKNTASDAHALPSNGSQSYTFAVYFTPPAAGLNLAGGTYFDTLTETISF